MKEGWDRCGQRWGGLDTDLNLCNVSQGKISSHWLTLLFYLSWILTFSKTCSVCVCVAQSCPTFWDPMGCSPPSSPVHGILQAGILESIAISWRRITRKGPLLNGAVCLSLAEKHRGRRWVDAGLIQTLPSGGPMGLCVSLCRNSLNFSF